MLMHWLPLLPLFTTMLLVAGVVGYPWARLNSDSRIISFVIGVAIAFAGVSILSFIWDYTNLRWSGWTVIPVLLLTSIPGWVLLLGRMRRTGIASYTVATMEPQKRASARSMIAAIVAGWVIAALPMLLRANPHDPAQQWDSTFHLNAIWSMLHTGEASPFGSFHELYGGYRHFYPNSWHAFVTLFSTTETVIEASNVSSLFLMALWVAGTCAFLRALSRNRTVILAGTVMSGGLLAMPADALTMYNQWPHATGAALVSPIVIIVIEAVRRFRFVAKATWASGRIGPDTLAGIRAMLPMVGLGFFTLIGAGMAHPSAIFFVITVTLPAIIVAFSLLAVRASANGSIGTVALWVGGLFVSVLLPVLALSNGKIRAMGAYPRSGLGWEFAFSRFLTPYPPFTVDVGLSMTVAFMGFFTFVGIFIVVTRGQAPQPLRHMWRQLGIPGWVLGSFLMLSLLTFLAYAPDSELRTFLLGPWYKDPRRIMAIHGLMMIPMAALGFAGIAHGVRHLVNVAIGRPDPADFPPGYSFPNSLPSSTVSATPTSPFMDEVTAAVVSSPADSSGGVELSKQSQWLTSLKAHAYGFILLVVVLAVTGGFAMTSRIQATDYVYDAANLGKPGMATPGELAMLRRMPTTLPKDAKVLGDPIAGAAYTEVIGKREAYFPQLSLANADTETQELLSQHFKDIHIDPKVCEAVKANNITHFYQDADGLYYSFMRSSRHPGFYDVDTSTGFELVDQGGTAKLWKINVCDE